jgi:hypothetical protein
MKRSITTIRVRLKMLPLSQFRYNASMSELRFAKFEPFKCVLCIYVL